MLGGGRMDETDRRPMNLYRIDPSKLKESPVKTTPQNVKEANEGLFLARMNLPEAAKHCGMSAKEMKLTFFEYLKYHPATYETLNNHKEE